MDNLAFDITDECKEQVDHKERSQQNKPSNNKNNHDEMDKTKIRKPNEYRKKNETKQAHPDKEWYFYTKNEKARFILTSILKCFLFLILLYFFLLSLSFMSIGFTLVSSYALEAGDLIKFLLSNPFAALSIGILLTALMQNATATTSIAVIMVGAGIIPDVKSAVPIIMGANIGNIFV